MSVCPFTTPLKSNKSGYYYPGRKRLLTRASMHDEEGTRENENTHTQTHSYGEENMHVQIRLYRNKTRHKYNEKNVCSKRENCSFTFFKLC